MANKMMLLGCLFVCNSGGTNDTVASNASALWLVNWLKSSSYWLADCWRVYNLMNLLIINLITNKGILNFSVKLAVGWKLWNFYQEWMELNNNKKQCGWVSPHWSNSVLGRQIPEGEQSSARLVRNFLFRIKRTSLTYFHGERPLSHCTLNIWICPLCREFQRRFKWIITNAI